MAEWLDKIHAAEGDIRGVVYELEALASAFSTTGNERVAQRLWKMADDLQAANKAIGEGVGETIYQQVQHGQDMNNSMFAMAIAVIVGQGPPPANLGDAQDAIGRLIGTGKPS